MQPTYVASVPVTSLARKIGIDISGEGKSAIEMKRPIPYGNKRILPAHGVIWTLDLSRKAIRTFIITG